MDISEVIASGTGLWAGWAFSAFLVVFFLLGLSNISIGRAETAKRGAINAFAVAALGFAALTASYFGNVGEAKNTNRWTEEKAIPYIRSLPPKEAEITGINIKARDDEKGFYKAEVIFKSADGEIGSFSGWMSLKTAAGEKSAFSYKRLEKKLGNGFDEGIYEAEAQISEKSPLRIEELNRESAPTPGKHNVQANYIFVALTAAVWIATQIHAVSVWRGKRREKQERQNRQNRDEQGLVTRDALTGIEELLAARPEASRGQYRELAALRSSFEADASSFRGVREIIVAQEGQKEDVSAENAKRKKGRTIRA